MAKVQTIKKGSPAIYCVLWTGHTGFFRAAYANGKLGDLWATLTGCLHEKRPAPLIGVYRVKDPEQKITLPARLVTKPKQKVAA